MFKCCMSSENSHIFKGTKKSYCMFSFNDLLEMARVETENRSVPERDWEKGLTVQGLRR